MKKITSLILLCFLTINLFSQEKKPQLASNELRINMLYTALGLPEISYERYLDDESSVGVSMAFSVDSSFDLNYIIIPNYRHYFGKKRAAGLFMEANAALFSENTYFFGTSKTGFGLGMAVGGKFVTKQNWTANLTLGLGRNFINNLYVDEAYPRIEISIGKRF
jgi:Protein of unknown function (DUF3575)